MSAHPRSFDSDLAGRGPAAQHRFASRPAGPPPSALAPSRGAGALAAAGRLGPGATVSAGLHMAALALALGALGDWPASPPPGTPVASVMLISNATFEAAGSRAPALPPGGPAAPPSPTRAGSPDQGPVDQAALAPPRTHRADTREPAIHRSAPAVATPPQDAAPIAPSAPFDADAAKAQSQAPETPSVAPAADRPATGASLGDGDATHAPTPPSRPRAHSRPAQQDAHAGQTPQRVSPGAAAPLSSAPGQADAASSEGRAAVVADSAGATGKRADSAALGAARTRYRTEISRRIERAKRAGSGGEGVGAALVELIIDAGGDLVGATLAQSSGLAVRDAAALSTVRRAAPFPPPPPEIAADPVVLRVTFR